VDSLPKRPLKSALRTAESSITSIPFKTANRVVRFDNDTQPLADMPLEALQPDPIRYTKTGQPYKLRSTEATACTVRVIQPAVLDHDGAGNPVPEEELEYGYRQPGFPTQRRPRDYRRPLDSARSADVENLLSVHPKLIGNKADTPEKVVRAKELLAT